MHMLYFKPTPKPTVETTPVGKAKAPKAPRLYLTPHGTLAPIEDIIDIDNDKKNNAGE